MNPIKLAILLAIVVGGYAVGGTMFDLFTADNPVSNPEGKKTLFSLGWMLWTGIGFAIFGGIASAIFGWLRK